MSARDCPLYASGPSRGGPLLGDDGRVPATLYGAFDMIAFLLALVLLRLELEGDGARADSVLLTETFIDDMDASLRQIGIGDFVVGKHVGRLVGALGGRLDSYRAALAGVEDFEAAVRRNIFRGNPDSAHSVAFVAAGLRRFDAGLADLTRDDLLAGELQSP